MAHHPQTTVWIFAFLLWISVSLIFRMWLVHRKASLIKKVLWSFVLLVPLFGWMLYGGFFDIPDSMDVQITYQSYPPPGGAV